MYHDTNKATMTNKCISSAGHFDGHGSVPEQYRWHCPMRHIQGYSGSHWTPPSGDYSLRITPVAARATGEQTTINKYTKKLAVSMAMAMHWYVTACIPQWRRSRALLEATGCCHWVSIKSNNIKGTWLRRFLFIVKP
jgi:hypothetical protein